MPQVTIDCIRTTSGYIHFDGSVYTAVANSDIEIWREWDAFGSALINEERGYYQFNTSDANTGIPAANTITKVELLHNYKLGPTTTPGNWTFDFWIYAGTFIGAALNGNAGEWNGGSLVAFGISGVATPSDFFMDLEDIGVLFNRSGMTDFKIQDASTSDQPENASWSMELSNGLAIATRGKLRITHEPPATPPPTFNASIGTPHAGI